MNSTPSWDTHHSNASATELKILGAELKPNGRVSGRADDGKLFFIKGSEELLGQIVEVKVVKTSRGALDGVLI